MDDGYGDVAYIGFRFVYAPATAAGSGIYSTTGAGGVIYNKKKSRMSIAIVTLDDMNFFRSKVETYLAHVGIRLMLLLLRLL